MYKYQIQSWPKDEWSATECAKITAEMTGVALSSVYKILKEYKEKGELEPPLKTGPKLSFVEKIDDFTFAAIRRKVHSFFFINEMPTIVKVSYSHFIKKMPVLFI